MDRISVIIPVFNIAQYLHRCLSSVLSQSYCDLDIIAINDGSADNSLDILREFALKDNRIKIIDKENGGVSSCRQIGLEVAEGTYVFFLDGDDWLENETIERLYCCAQEYNADIVIGNVYCSTDLIHRPLPADSFEKNSSIEFIHQLARGKQLWSLWMKLIKTSLCRQMKIPEGLSMAEDMTGILQLAYYARNISKVDYYGYHYYQRSNAATKTPSLEHAKDALLAAKYITDFFEEQGCGEKLANEIAWINLRCLLTSCNQGGIFRSDSLVEQIYKQYYKVEYLSIFGWPHRLILFGFKKGVNLYKILFAYRKWQFAIKNNRIKRKN